MRVQQVSPSDAWGESAPALAGGFSLACDNKFNILNPVLAVAYVYGMCVCKWYVELRRR